MSSWLVSSLVGESIAHLRRLIATACIFCVSSQIEESSRFERGGEVEKESERARVVKGTEKGENQKEEAEE